MKYLLGVLLIVCATLAVTALPNDIEQHLGERPVILVVFADRNDSRPFEFNLELSLAWDRLERLDAIAIDVSPGRYDVAAVARELGLGDSPFGVVVYDHSGEQIVRTIERASLAEILARLEEAR